MFGFLLTLFCVTFSSTQLFNNFPKSKLDGLTNEELSFSFTLSWLTWLNSQVWLKEWELATNKMQLDVASVRYQLAFTGYSAPSICYKTPAYRQICKNILGNAIDRMIDKNTWGAEVEFYWGPNSYEMSKGSCADPNATQWGAAPTFPDPVAYQNIMYSGHLAQMVTLYEAVTQNDTYSTIGWDFVYNDTTRIHYNTTKLLNALATMQLNDKNAQGGISCEPYRVFTECNQHQNTAFNVYTQTIAPNSYYDKARAKWTDFFVNGTPWNDTKYTNGSLQFEGWVKGIYLQDAESYDINDQGDGEWGKRHKECLWNNGETSSWATIPNSPPRDAWVASIAYLYLDEDLVNNFVCNDALVKLSTNRLWKYEPDYDGWVLRNHLYIGICWGTAMYAMAAKQCLYYNEMAAKTNKNINITLIEERIKGAQNYLINRYGVSLDNSYNLSAPFLDVKRCDNGFGSSVIDTADYVIGLTLYNDSWRQIHNNVWPKLQTSIEVLYVNYPTIMISYAKVEEEGWLKFELFVAVNENNNNYLNTDIQVKLDGIDNLVKVLQNGIVVSNDNLNINGNILIISVSVDTTQTTVFEVFTDTFKSL